MREGTKAMLERRGDLWVLADQVKSDAVCITTNGFVTQRGLAVLGRGCAKEAVQRWPVLPAQLGDYLRHNPEVKTVCLTNILRRLWENTQLSYHLVAFPVKPRQVIANNMSTNVVRHQRWNFGTGSKVPGWAAVADMNLIEKSSKELMQLIESNRWRVVLLPRPGCGAGELQWDEVRELIAPILDDRVICVSR
jgi:hypothetical protein